MPKITASAAKGCNCAAKNSALIGCSCSTHRDGHGNQAQSPRPRGSDAHNTPILPIAARVAKEGYGHPWAMTNQARALATSRVTGEEQSPSLLPLEFNVLRGEKLRVILEKLERRALADFKCHPATGLLAFSEIDRPKVRLRPRE